MPHETEILAGLQRIANEAVPFAVLWHIVVAAMATAVLLRWRPSPRLAGAFLVAPLVSVSAFAWCFGNPFNGASFALVAATLAWHALRAPPDDGRRSPPWAVALGAVLVAFAWTYPHFLVGRTALAYLVAAPMGLIPCPTLSLVIGATLLGLGPKGRGWSSVLAGAGGLYALFGALRLGVLIDLVLLAGALGLVLQSFGAYRTKGIAAA